MRHSHTNDDTLVALVDRILDGTENETGNSIEHNPSQDIEDTIRLLQQYTNPVSPNREMAQRIQIRLAAEWQKNGPGNRASQRTKRKNQRVLIISFATVVVLAGISTLFLIPNISENLQGSATEVSPIAAIVSLSIILLGITVWSAINNSRRRKK